MGARFPLPRTMEGSWGWAGISAVLSERPAPEGGGFPAQAFRSHSCPVCSGPGQGPGWPGGLPGCVVCRQLMPRWRDPSPPHLSSDSNLQSGLGPGEPCTGTSGWLASGDTPSRAGLEKSPGERPGPAAALRALFCCLLPAPHVLSRSWSRPPAPALTRALRAPHCRGGICGLLVLPPPAGALRGLGQCSAPSRAPARALLLFPGPKSTPCPTARLLTGSCSLSLRPPRPGSPRPDPPWSWPTGLGRCPPAPPRPSPLS